MSRLRVASFSVSLDGFGAGIEQSLENPMGMGGMTLHEWVFKTQTFQKMFGGETGVTGIDDEESRLNVNNASVEELQKLKDMTPAAANSIVQWRTSDKSTLQGGSGGDDGRPIRRSEGK